MPALSAAWMIIEPFGAAISTPSMKTVTWSGGRFGLTGWALMLALPGLGTRDSGLEKARTAALGRPDSAAHRVPGPESRVPLAPTGSCRHLHQSGGLIVDQETLVDDRVLELAPEVMQEALHRPRGGFAERADGVAFDLAR